MSKQAACNGNSSSSNKWIFIASDSGDVEEKQKTIVKTLNSSGKYYILVIFVNYECNKNI